MGVGTSSLWKPFTVIADGDGCCLLGSTGVFVSSVSESDWPAFGVAFPLSLDTHSSSSPSEGLEIVKPARCLPSLVRVVTGGGGARLSCAGATCSREGKRLALLILDSVVVRVIG